PLCVETVDYFDSRWSERGEPLPIDATIGIPTKGKWPINCVNQRVLIAGGRCRRTGITTSDITSQMKGPYSYATLISTYVDLCKPAIHAARLTTNRTTRVRTKATPKGMRMPIAAVRAPPLSDSLPSNVEATP